MKWIAVLVGVCLFAAPLAAQAAPGDQTVFVNRDIDTEDEMWDFYAAEIVLLDDMFYAWGQQKLYRWQVGMERPELFCELPEYPDYWESYETAEPEVKRQLGEVITSLAAGDGKLWAFNSYAGRIGEIGEQGVRWLDVEMDMTDMTSIEGAEKWVRQRTMIHCFVKDGGFYCLRDNYSDDSWADNYTLIRFDMSTGEQTQIETRYAQIACLYKPGQLLTFGSLYDEKTEERVSRFTAVDLSNGVETELPFPQITEPWGLGGLAYDAVSDTVYYTYQKQIWKSEKGEPFSAVAYLTQAGVFQNSTAWVLSDGLYAVSANGLYIRNVDPQFKAARALRISGGWEDAGYMEFTSRHPDIPVLIDYSYYSGAETIAQEITGGNFNTDIYVLSVRSGLRELIDKNFTADLSESTTVAQDVEAMYPQARDALTDTQGRPMAYPRFIDHINPWSLHTKLWEKFDMGPLPTTYAQFFDCMMRWQEEFADDNPDIAFLDGSYDGTALAEVILRNYILYYEEPGKPIEFNASILRQVLEQIGQLELETYIFDNMTDEDWERLQELRNRPAIFSMYSRTGLFYDPGTTVYVSSDPEFSYDRYDNYKPLLPMVFEEGQRPILRAGMDVMIINPTSLNIDLAMQYIENYAKEGMDHYARYALCPDLNEPIERQNFDLEVKGMEEWRDYVIEALEEADGLTKRDLEDNLDYLDRWLSEQDQNKWELSAVAIANYREMAEYMDFTPRSLFFRNESGAMDMLRELLTRYTDGQLSLDAFLRELDSKMRMIVLEGQ